MSYNGKTTSVSEILWRVLRNPICQDLTLDQASEFALEFLRLIGAPLAFLDKVDEIKINNYKGLLPDNLLEIRGIRSEGRALRYATDLYHQSIDNNGHDYHQEYTYIIQDCIITTSFREGCVEVSYKSISTDEIGYPLIPDNESYKMGLEYYILNRYIEPLWIMGKLPDKVFQYISQQRDWYLGQASSSLVVANADHLQSIMNGINRVLINTNAFDNFYKNYGTKERLIKY